MDTFKLFYDKKKKESNDQYAERMSKEQKTITIVFVQQKVSPTHRVLQLEIPKNRQKFDFLIGFE